MDVEYPYMGVDEIFKKVILVRKTICVPFCRIIKNQYVENDYCIIRYRYDIIYHENPGNDPCTTKVGANRRGYGFLAD